MAALLQGDCREALAVMEPDTFDACVTDPPYELGFMGRAWDRSGVAFEPATWAAVLRVLKPGAHLVAFGAPKNYHRLACAIEDAGFEVRDCLMWIFGQGFPKNKNLLKPAYEPILLARKPGPFISLGIDACRIATGDDLNGGAYADVSTKGRSGSLAGGVLGSTGRAFTAPLGRWPANVVHDGSDEVLAGFPQTKSGALSPANNVKASTGWSGGSRADRVKSTFEPNGGSAARFFYCAKASAKDRAGSKHPTVKPIALMRWLCRLITPPGGLILDPFAGSGTTGQAAAEEGFRATLIERQPEYVADITRRLNQAPPLLAAIGA